MPERQQRQQVRVSNSAVWRLLLLRIGQFAGAAAVAAAVLYLCFAATVLRVVPTTTELGPVPVRNAAYEGGYVPVGEQVLVNFAEPTGEELWDRLKQAFTPASDVAIMEVVAGPFGELTWAPPNVLMVDGKPVEYPYPSVDGESPFAPESRDVVAGTAQEKVSLDGSYVFRCISGACVPDQAYIIPHEYVMGDPLRTYGDDSDNNDPDNNDPVDGAPVGTADSITGSNE